MKSLRETFFFLSERNKWNGVCNDKIGLGKEFELIIQQFMSFNFLPRTSISIEFTD